MYPSNCCLKHLQAHPSSSLAKVDLKVVICSQCARVIADGEPLTEVTASQLTQTSSRSLEGDFESASQVGSQSQFPQWEASSALSGELSSIPLNHSSLRLICLNFNWTAAVNVVVGEEKITH